MPVSQIVLLDWTQISFLFFEIFWKILGKNLFERGIVVLRFFDLEKRIHCDFLKLFPKKQPPRVILLAKFDWRFFIAILDF